MGHYRQYCPLARASEILAERWNPLIVRNLMFGADTFNEIARGVPSMSRSLLLKRLDELERAGVLTRGPKTNGHGRRYQLTPAGKDLAGAIDALSDWGERWLEVTTEHSDPGFALWAWCRLQLDYDRLPQRRTLVAFIFPAEQPTNRRYWLLAENRTAELCYSDPGGEPDATVTANSLAFVNWHRGALPWDLALRDGAIEVSGDPAVLRDLPGWNTHRPVVHSA